MEQDNSEQIIEINGKDFQFICYSQEIKEGKGKRITFKDDIDTQFAVFRINGKLYCVSNICPHRHATKTVSYTHLTLPTIYSV